MMAGGAELEALSHELSRQMPDSEVARTRSTRSPRRSPSTRPTRRGPGDPALVAPRDLRVAVVGFGWMGQVHSRAWARLLHHYPDSAVRPRLVAVADPEKRAGRGPGVLRLRGGARRLGRAARARRRRRGQRLRPELRAPRDRVGRRRVGPAPVGREARGPLGRGRLGHRGGRPHGRRDVGGRLQLPQRPGRRAGPRARGRGPARSGRERSRCGCSPTTPPTPTARCRGASTRRTPAPGCSATWPATASTSRRTSGASRSARSQLVADQATFITERPVATGAVSHYARGGDGPRGAVGNEDQVAALLRFASGASGYLTASRVAVGEQSALRHRGARHHGRAGLGLPADGRAAGVPGPGLPGRDVADPPRRTRRRRPRRLPARRRQRDGLRRPQGGRGAPARPAASSPAPPRARTIDDVVVTARADRGDGASPTTKDDG